MVVIAPASTAWAGSSLQHQYKLETQLEEQAQEQKQKEWHCGSMMQCINDLEELYADNEACIRLKSAAHAAKASHQEASMSLTRRHF